MIKHKAKYSYRFQVYKTLLKTIKNRLNNFNMHASYSLVPVFLRRLIVIFPCVCNNLGHPLNYDLNLVSN